MGRLLLLIAIVAVVFLLVRSYRRNAPPQDKPDAEDMVRCAHCGVHLPKGESLQDGGHFFCGAEHRDAYRR
ncbi:MAG: hypothetical protein EPN14_10500 [Gallionella sp.]|nr:MAG: hypothetical protein EPN14_10500 [Gallionella sp.]